MLFDIEPDKYKIEFLYCFDKDCYNPSEPLFFKRSRLLKIFQKNGKIFIQFKIHKTNIQNKYTLFDSVKIFNKTFDLNKATFENDCFFFEEKNIMKVQRNVFFYFYKVNL